MASNALVQTRIDGKVKEEAATVLKGMGLTVSDAVRLLLLRVAHDGTLPFDVRMPNAATRAAMAEAEAGGTARFASIGALMDDLSAGN